MQDCSGGTYGVPSQPESRRVLTSPAARAHASISSGVGILIRQGRTRVGCPSLTSMCRASTTLVAGSQSVVGTQQDPPQRLRTRDLASHRHGGPPDDYV